MIRRLIVLSILLGVAGCDDPEAEAPAPAPAPEPEPAPAPEPAAPPQQPGPGPESAQERPPQAGPYLVERPDGFAVVQERPADGDAIDLSMPSAPEPARTHLRVTITARGAGNVIALANGSAAPREVTTEGSIHAADLAPLFEGADAWDKPVDATIEAPRTTQHADVVALIDALRSHEIERFSLQIE